MDNQGQRHFPHGGAQAGQGFGGGDYGVPHFGVVGVGMHPFGYEADFEAGNVAVQGGGVIGRGGVPSLRVFGVVAGDGRQRVGAVGHGAGNRPGGVHRPAGAEHPVPADQPESGPDAHQPAEGRRPPDAAAGVLAQGSGAQKGGRGRPGAAAGSAGAAPGVPRIARAPVGMPESVAAGVFAHIELAQQHGAGFPQPRHYGGVLVGHILRQDGGAVGGDDAGGIELVLDGDRHAVQGAAAVAGGDFGVGAAGVGAGPVGGYGDIGSVVAVQPGDAFQVGFGSLQGRHGAGGDALPQLGSRQVAKAGIGHYDTSIMTPPRGARWGKG